MKEVVRVYWGYEQRFCDIMCVLNFTVAVANCLLDFLYKLDFQIFSAQVVWPIVGQEILMVMWAGAPEEYK